MVLKTRNERKSKELSPLSLVDIGAPLAQKRDHLLRPERRGPVQERLADVVHEVDLDVAAVHGLNESVSVLEADAVDQLPKEKSEFRLIP